MGWLFHSTSRDELIQKLTCPYESEKTSSRTIAHSLCIEDGVQVLWTLVEITSKVHGGHRNLAAGESVRYIFCELLDCHHGKWGSKGMDESMQPYYYSCPLSYLPQAKEVSPTWRGLVRQWHLIRARKANPGNPAYA
jgi:hypothetical protein